MKILYSFMFQAFLLAAFLLIANDGNAQSAGSLDTAFGDGGKVVTHLSTTATLRDIIVQPDGKIVVAGITFYQQSPSLTAFVARFNSNGTFDLTFDGDGYNNSGFMSDANAVALQSDGKIVVSGFSGSFLSVARFKTDGSLDSSFNGIGKVDTTVGTNPIAYSVNVQSDGKILAVGTTVLNGNTDFALVRYNPDGSLDNSFGAGGRVATNINGNDIAYDSAVQADGKIIAVGYSTDALANIKSATMVRYNSDGSIDTTFGNTGKIVRSSTTNSSFNKVNIQPDGKIIVGGSGFPLSRYNQNGTFDIDFDTGNTFAAALKFQKGGKILTAGSASNGTESVFALVRYNADGTRDTTFGANGMIFTAFNSGTSFSIAAFQPDGKVVGGGTMSANNFQIVLARYFGDALNRKAAIDFDGDGKADVSVFRPLNGYWYTSANPATNYGGVQFGAADDKLVPADYDGDGKTDVAVYRGGTWYIQQSTAGFTGVTFGDANDIPVPADYDCDGKADIAVFRPSNGTWYLQRSQLGFTGVQFGQNGDKPVPADYDGDGKADITVNRAGTWYINRSQLGFYGVQFGTADDKLVPADYDGDGKADVAVFRPSNGVWYLQQSTAGFTGIAFGLGTDIPTPADYDGDGKADVAVFRNGTWYLNRSSQGFIGVAFGASTDMPIPNVYVR